MKKKSNFLSVCEEVMLRNTETRDDYLSGVRRLESLPACFALTLVTMTSIKTGCDDTPSIAVSPQWLKVQPVKEQLTDFPTESMIISLLFLMLGLHR